MKNGSLNILIGGPAGSGIEKSGQVLALSFVRAGYFVFSNMEHSSQIRGGNNFLRLRIDENAHEVHTEETDAIIAFDKQTIDEHIHEVVEGGVIIFDGESVEIGNGVDSRFRGNDNNGVVKMIDVPLKKMASEDFGNPLVANMISLGVLFGLTEFEMSVIRGVLEKIWGKKGAEIITMNLKALDAGKKIADEKWTKGFVVKMPNRVDSRLRGNDTKSGNDSRMFLCGNDALCIGAIKAGCKFVGEYPMTPSSSVLHFMAGWAEKYGIVVKHVEDEIAAVHSVIGAGFAGVRAIAATSGGGFALMSEGIGLAGMNEVPIVVVDVMRPGPATGLPTRTGQGDLQFMIHAGQDDPIKIVLLASSPEECFEMGFEAFNLSEKYQLPVIIGYDKYLGEGYYTVPAFKKESLKIDRGKLLSASELEKISDYKRYLRTDDGVSPRAIPGQKNGIHRATSDEHTEYGEICEDAENRKAMVDKRMKKMEMALKELPGPELIGDADADITFVTWNSSVGACLEAAEILREKKKNINVLKIRTAWPFHKKETKEILKKVKRPILVEQNYNGQMGALIAEQTGIIIQEKILKYDGRPFTAKEIIENLK
ncbi:MAG: 2-oxoacid:acceptor oxidoreductase subunit alpha [Candidatus Gracilibacteria bacterium]|nr:2-oxoacid:acceptor oxidoreductase subunit alpha [Candidatus Gracilibacteria bacterium]